MAIPVPDWKNTTAYVYHRMDKASFDRLRSQCNAVTVVTHQVTDIQAGFMLGVQHVLNAVRDGFVIETPQT